MSYFFKLPEFIQLFILENIQYNRNLDYAEITVIEWINVGLLCILILALIMIVTRLLSKYLRKRVHIQALRVLIVYIAVFITNVCGLLISLIVLVFPSLFYGIGKISFALCVIITFLITMLEHKLLDYQRTSLQKHTRTNKLQTKNRKVGIKVWSILDRIILTYAAVAIPMMLENTCFASWAPYGVKLPASLLISTKMHREHTLKTICPPGPPCHVYATLSEDTSTAFFLNIHTAINVSDIAVYFETKDYYDINHSLRFETPTVYWPFDLEATGARNVHATHITNLTPDTEYYFEIHYDGKSQYNGAYRTLPAANSTRELVIAIGGDVGSSNIAQKMTSNLETISPDVIIIGGDGAYDNGMRSCYYNYDLFFNMFETLNQQLGRIVPLIVGIGNHELGIHSSSQKKVHYSDTEGPLYFMYFPQHLATNHIAPNRSLSNVPRPADRKTYFSQVIGNTVHMSLDSGYMTAINGTQAQWLRETSAKYPSLAKYANYHVPTFPSCHLWIDTPDAQTHLAYETWGAIFEEFGYEAVFEHHFHLFKKTFPIKNGKVDEENGVIYLGEGKWGASGNHCLEFMGVYNESGLIQTATEEHHIWILNVSANSWKYYPINPDGVLFDGVSTKNFSLVLTENL